MSLTPQPQPSKPDPTQSTPASAPGLPPAKLVTEVGEADFAKEVLQATQPVLVDFFTPTCGPCRKLAPTLDLVAKDFAATMKVVKCNVADHYQIAVDQNVTAVPTLKLFIGGQVVWESLGVIGKDALTREIQKFVKP
jgi:thioredoxin 1